MVSILVVVEVELILVVISMVSNLMSVVIFDFELELVLIDFKECVMVLVVGIYYLVYFLEEVLYVKLGDYVSVG